MNETKSSEYSARIVAHLETALTRALSSMTGLDFSVVSETGEGVENPQEPIIWEQAFSFAPDVPALWLVAGKDLWAAAGQMTLAAVGIDSVTDEDCRSTWSEIAGQTVGALATGITSETQHEVTAAAGAEALAEPTDITWVYFRASHDELTVWHLKAGWRQALTAQYDKAEPERKSTATTAGSTFSRTLELLLDVALPVSVSFGKTSLQIREVLKLSTGSIVELNRLVIEPVDVIVNDCVIARGEVVVVDGNYGVRVTHLASKEDRLRFGMAETSGRVAANTGVGA